MDAKTYQRILEKGVAGETQAAANMLAAARAKGEAGALAAEMMRRGESVANAVADKRARPACQKGCAWCCKGVRVDVLAPEAILIAEAMRKALAPEQLEAERAAVSAAAENSRGLSVDEYARRAIRCVFLAPDDSCAIHSIRPFACRAHASFDASACERACKTPDDQNTVPLDLLSRLEFDPCRTGLKEAAAAAGLDARAFELAGASHIAFEDADAGPRWLAGERLFEAASVESTAEEDRTSREASFPSTRNRSRNARKRQRRAKRGKQ